MNDLVVIQCCAMMWLSMSVDAACSKFGSGIGLLRLFLSLERPGMNDHWLVFDLWRNPCFGASILLLKKTVTLEPWMTHGCFLSDVIDERG